MTQKQFSRRYPDGLNNTIANFDKAMFQIMTTDEIDKIIKHCHNRKERKWLKDFKGTYLEIVSRHEGTNGVGLIPWILMLAEIKSVDLLQNVLCVMNFNDKAPRYFGEDLADD